MAKQRRKEVEQAKLRAERKAELQRKKARLSEEPSMERGNTSTPMMKRILVVAEGENTEYSYFSKFRIPGVLVVPVGVGLGTMSLVKEVERIRAKNIRKYHCDFDETWVVFDKDEYPDFVEAIKYAENCGYKVAYSNQAFEYWLLLHFNNHQGQPMDRSHYIEAINRHLSQIKPSVKIDSNSKIIDEKVFELLNAINPLSGRSRLQEAFDRASAIYDSKLLANVPFEESVTTVHLLLKSIANLRTTKEQRKTVTGKK
ncbi:MAG: RloB family protein [Muribaculaceae bacterium]|nr:RloB family protein [Muribaculaceae bacterium]